MVDTSLACIESTTLLGLIAQVDHELDNRSSSPHQPVILREVREFLKKKLDENQVSDLEKHYTAFKVARATGIPAPSLKTTIKSASLQCDGPTPHSRNYQVTC
jgi:hypothetical protein